MFRVCPTRPTPCARHVVIHSPLSQRMRPSVETMNNVIDMWNVHQGTQGTTSCSCDWLFQLSIHSDDHLEKFVAIEYQGGLIWTIKQSALSAASPHSCLFVRAPKSYRSPLWRPPSGLFECLSCVSDDIMFYFKYREECC